METEMTNEPKIGSSYERLDTPALLLDVERFQRNLAKMAGFFAGRPASLRPHAKTHKCPHVALRQIDAGAIGITCAKVGEAEVMVEAGIQDILIANEVVGPIKMERLTALARRCRMMVAVDDADNVQELSRACQARDVSLRILVEMDVGMKRCGVQSAAAAARLAREVDRAPGLEFVGLMGYEGHLVMIKDREEKTARVRQAIRPLQEACELLQQDGLAPQIVSGGGTGTYDITGTCEPMTEIQAGSYVFMDSTYLQVRPEFEPALTVLSTVVSRPVKERIVTDAGMKTMTKEFGLPLPLNVEGASLRGLSEEHGILELAQPDAVHLRPGDKVRFVPSHCCTTVNLHDRLYVLQNDVLVDIWPISARGRAQ
jgi:D-serine deaminase-like pyridoxal phosphate-dependent protein